MHIHTHPFQFDEPLEALNEVKNIIVHHTSREQMNAKECHEFHQQDRGWAGIGYNFFIEKDGTIIEGRGLHVGAHAYGHNRNSIGICLTGDFDMEYPTKKQWRSFLELCHHFMTLYQLKPEQILGHRELKNASTTCPGTLLNMSQMRAKIKKHLEKE